jgi:hypothetical protein
MITFWHDAPTVLATHIDRAWLQQMLQNIQLVFVNAKGMAGKLERRALHLPELELRPHVLYNHITIRQALGQLPYMKAPSFEHLQSLLADSGSTLWEGARHIEDDTIEQAMLGSYIRTPGRVVWAKYNLRITMRKYIGGRGRLSLQSLRQTLYPKGSNPIYFPNQFVKLKNPKARIL